MCEVLERRQLSSARACGLVTLSSLCVLMMSGLVFGFSSIFPVLYTQRVFVDSCGEDAARECRDEGVTTSKCCDRQFEQYSLMSSAALFAADGVFVFCARRPPARPRTGPRTGPRPTTTARAGAQTARRWTGWARGRASSPAPSSPPSASSPSAPTSTSHPTPSGFWASSHSASPGQVIDHSPGS